MPRPGIRVEGADELRRELRRVKDVELNRELKQIHGELAEEVIEKALPNVPVRTGKLKSTVRGSGTVKDAIGRAGKQSVPYAAAVHWKYGPPFLTDAAAEVERDVVDRYDAAVADMLNRVIGR